MRTTEVAGRLVKLEVEPFKSVERWPPGCKTWEETYGEEDA
jgi:hypothetical protein